MKKRIKTTAVLFFSAPCILLFLAGCYDSITPIEPNVAGFHMVQNPPFVSRISGMAADGDRIVGISYEEGIVYSEDDGVNWIRIDNDDIQDNFIDGIFFNAVAWGDGFFLAGGDGGKAAYSEDGLKWHAGVIGPMSPKNILCIAIGRIMNQTVFVAAGNDGRIAHAAGSPRGPWYMASLTPFGTADGLGETIRALSFGVVDGSGMFVAVGDDGKIAFMNDLSGKWYGSRAGTGETFRGIAFGNDRFIAVGDNGIMKTCSDPAAYHWLSITDTDFTLRPFYGIVFDSAINHFIVFGAESVIGFSEYGVSWTAASFQARFSDGMSAITCTKRRIVIGGADGTLAYSN
ncbi:MAG: hypothetical protein LBR99_06230 [Treponema sp.]|jgi:hypothetical protein|nr:hypothetical protein [Treponema sp.]